MTTLAELATAHCTLRGAEHQLSSDRIAALLAVLPAGWRLVDDGPAIEKTFRFADYHRTMAYVNALAFIAHAEDHHPDLGVHYDRCVVRFSTHDVGGCRSTISSVPPRPRRCCSAEATRSARGIPAPGALRLACPQASRSSTARSSSLSGAVTR